MLHREMRIREMSNRKIAIAGISYLGLEEELSLAPDSSISDIDDLRESPALYITRRLIADGLDVLAVEPNISEHQDFDVVNYKEAVEQADVVTFLVAHKEFKELDMESNLDFCGVLV